MDPETAAHLDELKALTADAVKNIWTAVVGASVIMAGAVTISEIIEKSPIPLFDNSAKESFADAVEGIGAVGGGLFVALGVGSAAVLGMRAAYHQHKVQEVYRKEAIAKSFENIFYWQLAPNDSHQNGNI